MKAKIERGVLTVEEAAGWLRAAPNTLRNWISLKRFTKADGLRHFGGCTRIHFPTMRERAIADTLLTPDNTQA